MQAQEVEHMVARLSGDTSDYQRAFLAAKDTNEEFLQSLQVTMMGVQSAFSQAQVAKELVGLEFAAAAAGSIGTMVVAVGQLSAQLYSFMPSIRDFNASTEESERLNQLAAKAIKEHTSAAVEFANSLTGGDKKTQLDLGFEQQSKLAADLQQELKQLKASMDDGSRAAQFNARAHAEAVKDGLKFGVSAERYGSKQLEVDQATLANLAERYQLAKDAANAFDAARRKVQSSGEAFVSQLNFEAKSFGLSSNEAKILRMELEGVDAATIAAAKSVAAQIQVLEDNDRANKAMDDACHEAMRTQEAFDQSIVDFTKHLEAQNATFGLGAEQARIYEFAQKGATESQLAGARAAIAQKEALEQNKKELEELAKMNKQWQREADEAKRGLEQFSSPLEKYNRRIAELTKWLETAGIHFEDEFKAGVKAAEQELAKALATSDKLANSLDTLKFGSAAAREDFAKFKDSFAADREFQKVIGATKVPKTDKGIGVPAAPRSPSGPTDDGMKENNKLLAQVVTKLDEISNKETLTVSPSNIA